VAPYNHAENLTAGSKERLPRRGSSKNVRQTENLQRRGEENNYKVTAERGGKLPLEVTAHLCKKKGRDRGEVPPRLIKRDPLRGRGCLPRY